MGLQRISGNDGHDQKYLVVAKNGNVVLGVYLRTVDDYYRPTVGGESMITISGRVRIAAAPGETATDTEVNEAFKTLPLEKFACGGEIIRASFSLGLFLNQTKQIAVSGAFDEQKVGSKLFSYLLQFIDESLFVVTREEMHEAIKAEIGATNEESSTDVIAFGMQITEKDPSFTPGITSVLTQLEKARTAAGEAFKAATDKALREALATAQILVEEYLKVNPGFTTARDESTPAEFKLLTFLYEGLLPGDSSDPEDEDDAQYDA